MDARTQCKPTDALHLRLKPSCAPSQTLIQAEDEAAFAPAQAGDAGVSKQIFAVSGTVAHESCRMAVAANAGCVAQDRPAPAAIA